MKDPERLLNVGATDEERLLLAAGVGEQPPAEGPERLRVLLGLSGALLASGAVAASANSLPPAAAAANAVLTTGKTAALGATLKVSTAKLVLPWLVLALTGAGILGSVFVLEQRRSQGTRVQQPRLVAPTPVLPAPVLAPDRQEPALRDATPNEQPHDDSEPPARALPKSAPKLAQSIARETADLDAARAALRAGSVPRALQELDRYARRHPRGVLRQEASVLRIEALLRARDASKAQRTAQRFLSEHPDSPYAARVRSLLDDAARLD
jgi:hypothetical protein